MLKARRNKVIIKPNEKVVETESGIYTGERYNAELGLRRGEVISVGEGCREVKVGDEACWMAHSGLPIHFEGERYLTMLEYEVVGITI